MVAVRGLARARLLARLAGSVSASGRARAGGGIWVHAVSVGEVQAAAILIEALREREPRLEITLTCATPTGRARARALLPGVDVRYAPYDLPGSVRRCLRALRPRLLIVIETELWPNLLHRGAARAGVPTLIASARISARSARHLSAPAGAAARGACAPMSGSARRPMPMRERFARSGVPPQRCARGRQHQIRSQLPPELSRARRAAARALRRRARRSGWRAARTRARSRSCSQAHRQLLRAPAAGAADPGAAPPAALRCRRGVAGAQGFAGRRASTLPRATAPTARMRSAIEVLLLDTLGELARVLCRGRRGLRRRQPGAGRRPQPARAGCARRAGAVGAAAVQQSGARAGADASRVR